MQIVLVQSHANEFCQMETIHTMSLYPLIPLPCGISHFCIYLQFYFSIYFLSVWFFVTFYCCCVIYEWIKIIFFFENRVWLCSPGLIQTLDLTSLSQVLGLQMCTMRPDKVTSLTGSFCICQRFQIWRPFKKQYLLILDLIPTFKP
jgi:hypothetical protein